MIISSDKTQITLFGGKTAYPVYLTIGNIPKEICRKPLRRAQILLAYLPTTSLEHITNVAARRRMVANLTHVCLSKIMQPLKDYGKPGLRMSSGSGEIRRCHPIFAADVGDYLEQIAMVCCKMGECPECQCPHDDMGNFDAKYDTRDLKNILAALELYDNPDYSITEFTRACENAGVKPIVHPFWEGLPYCNIFRCITPDILHQLHQGLIKHLVSWIKATYDNAELDARVRRLPPNHHIRNFFKGITSLLHVTGREHSDMARILLGLVADMKMPDEDLKPALIQAIRALLDFLYLAQYPVHSTQTLAYLHSAIERFHEDKHVFVTMGIRKDWNLPKLHFAKHYMKFIKWLGTTDNYNTEYTERLHIDFAKDAYEATNHKDEFEQMCLWLECREKMQEFQLYVENRISNLGPLEPQDMLSKFGRKKSDIPILVTLQNPLHNLQLPMCIKMTKHPSVKAVPYETLSRSYDAKFFETALADCCLRAKYPDDRIQGLNRMVPFHIIPIVRVPVYHRARFWLGEVDQHRLISNEYDVVHATPGQHRKPGRFDTVIINDYNGQYTGVKGMFLYTCRCRF